MEHHITSQAILETTGVLVLPGSMDGHLCDHPEGTLITDILTVAPDLRYHYHRHCKAGRLKPQSIYKYRPEEYPRWVLVVPLVPTKDTDAVSMIHLDTHLQRLAYWTRQNNIPAIHVPLKTFSLGNVIPYDIAYGLKHYFQHNTVLYLHEND